MDIDLIILILIVLNVLLFGWIFIPNRKWKNPSRTAKNRNGRRRDQWEQQVGEKLLGNSSFFLQTPSLYGQLVSQHRQAGGRKKLVTI